MERFTAISVWLIACVMLVVLPSQALAQFSLGAGVVTKVEGTALVGSQDVQITQVFLANDVLPDLPGPSNEDIEYQIQAFNL